MFNSKKSIFIIAEAGVNHNGDINIAKKLVDTALCAGVDAIKFQTYKSEKLVTRYADMANYQKKNIGDGNSQYEMLKKLQLSFDDFIELKRYCEFKGILFLSTPFDFESADFLQKIEMPAFKISSGDLTNIPLLQHISSFNKPIILSSGMSNLGEIEEAMDAANFVHQNEIAVLHCTSNYPAKYDTVNLKAMNTIKNAFKIVVGYSDHTEGIMVPIAAVALGAKIIEKHFTLDKTMDGPDHKASLEPEELKSMVNSIRKIEVSLGDGVKKYNQCEIDTIKAARKSIVASRDILKGEYIKFEDLEFKRPGSGIPPKFYKEIINKKLREDVKLDQQLFLNMFE